MNIFNSISPGSFENRALYRTAKRSKDVFSYSTSPEKGTYEINGTLPDVGEEYERLLSGAAGIRASVSDAPSYSVSSSQAEYLSEKYDVDNMPQGSAQEREFLDELVSMNIISEKDARLFGFNCGGSVKSVSSYASAVPFDENLSGQTVSMWKDNYTVSDSIIDRLMAVIDTQKNISAYYKSRCADRENALECDLNGLAASESFLNGKKKMLTVLCALNK